MNLESLNHLSATTIGAGHVTPRLAKAAKRSSSMFWVRVSLSWQRRPGPVGLGRRMAKSSGMMRWPSPMPTKERGKHEADEFAQQLLVGLQAAVNLGYQRLGKIQVFEGLMDGLNRVLGLSTLLLEAFLGFESTAFSGFGLFVGVSFHGGHGAFLRTV